MLTVWIILGIAALLTLAGFIVWRYDYKRTGWDEDDDRELQSFIEEHW